MTEPSPLGVSGRIARFFLSSQLTPLIAIVLVMAGVFAVIVTPREEEPQIDVTMANVFIPFPGASAKDVETLVAIPAEQVLSQIPGLEHVWSVSRPGQALITVQYKVGRAAHRGHRPAARHDPVAPGLAAARAQRRRAARPAEGHRRRSDRRADAVDEGPRARRVRPRAGRARGRGGAEARARHARGDDDRRARPGRAGAARPREAQCARARGRGSEAGAAGGEHRAARRHDRSRQRDDLRGDRRVPADREGGARARRRRPRRAAGVSRRRRAGRGRPAPARALRVARASARRGAARQPRSAARGPRSRSR